MVFGNFGKKPNLYAGLAHLASGLGQIGGAAPNTSLVQSGTYMDQQRRKQQQQQKFAEMMRDPKYASLLPKSVQGMAQNGMIDPATYAQLAMKNHLANQRMAQGPAPTAMMRNYRMSQQDPNFARFLNSRTPQTNVTVNSGNRQLGKRAADYIFKNAEDAQSARENLNRYSILGDLIKDPNVYTGAAGETVNAIKKLAQSFRVEVEGVGVAEQIQQISRQAALSFRGKMPGSMSNDDRKFLVSLPPGLSKTPEGNRLIIETARLAEQYRLERAQAVVDYGRADIGVLRAGREIDAKYNRLFSNQVARMKQLGKAQPRSPLAGVPNISSQNDYLKLPSGSKFMAPDGTVRMKP